MELALWVGATGKVSKLERGRASLPETRQVAYEFKAMQTETAIPASPIDRPASSRGMKILAAVTLGVVVLIVAPWAWFWIDTKIPTDRAPLAGEDPTVLPPANPPAGRSLSLKDIAGDYYRRAPTRESLEIAPGGGWSYSALFRHGGGTCSYGDVTVQDGRLLFRIKSPWLADRWKTCAATVAWWGDWTILLGRDDLVTFPDVANWEGAAGLERYFYICKRSPSPGVLSLPEDMKVRILRAPLHGVLDPHNTVAFGSAEGAFPGMGIRSDPCEGEVRFFVVSSTDEHSCVLQPTGAENGASVHEGLKVWCDAKSADLIR